MGDDQRDMLDPSNVGNLVAEIEEALYQAHCEDTNNQREYKDQIRAIKSNLADKKNPEFNARIYLGAIGVKYLATMASTEMASDAKKRERQKAKKVRTVSNLSRPSRMHWKLARVTGICAMSKGQKDSFPVENASPVKLRTSKCKQGLLMSL